MTTHLKLLSLPENVFKDQFRLQLKRCSYEKIYIGLKISDQKNKKYVDESLVSLVKRIFSVLLKTIRNFMTPHICKESTFEERHQMYKKALIVSRKNSRQNRFSTFKKQEYGTVFKTMSISSSTGLTTGLIGGAVVGGICGGFVGSAIGGGIGTVVGLIVGPVTGNIIVKKEYTNWKKKISAEKFITQLIEFHKDHEELKDFICPLSLEIMMDPVITPYNHKYEREAICQWISIREEQLKYQTRPDWSTTDPLRCGRLKIEDLRTDYNTIVKMHGVYSRILADDLKLNKLPREIKEGLVAIKKDIDSLIKIGIKLAKEDYLALYEDKKITKEKFLSLSAESARISVELIDFINPK